MDSDVQRIAVVGLGPMGQALATAFARAGHEVTVWNRTPGKAEGLPVPVSVAGSVSEVVRAADVVVACLIDDAAVRGVVEGVDFEGRPLVNLTSSDPRQAREMARWADVQGFAYLPGVILTPTPMIGTPAGTVLLSGDAGVYDRVASALAALGERIVYLGPDPARASAFDVALLDLFATATNGLLHAFALAGAEGIAPSEFAGFAAGMGGLLPEMATRFAGQIESGEFPGSRSTIASAASSVRHITAAAREHGLDTGMLDAAQGVIEHAVAQGHGADGLGRLATMFGPR
ncbi:3-hydroxyisobutyrate dehydrogenase-like beta-hydroxyacid dehydrogenase [Catenulispora sp. MAP5-51]|uniref:NAD(P)-dependent oxidoreductase n=1 Tax=Catenulispora sp. MAP5-51 TaxID=3156298 RepID=UPI003518ABD6